jgi:hypothetical protein
MVGSDHRGENQRIAESEVGRDELAKTPGKPWRVEFTTRFCPAQGFASQNGNRTQEARERTKQKKEVPCRIFCAFVL